MSYNLKWINRYTQLFKEANNKKGKVCDIPEKSVVETSGEIIDEYEKIIYKTSNSIYVGFVNINDLEDYVRNFRYDIVELENQTPDPHDLEQYVYINKMKQTNLCGQICIAQILQTNLSDVLSKWEQTNASLFKRIFGTGKARGTGPEELISMLKDFGVESHYLQKALYQKHINRSRYTIKAINELLDNGNIIASVRINQFTGLVEQTGVLHWISLIKIIPERNGQGAVMFYNPAMDSEEVCSYGEFIRSARTPYGVYIPRKS